MSTLKDAVQSVYQKVQTDLTAATPEELAYLSTSLEKLGGRATVYDVMDMGEDYKVQIQNLADQIISDLNIDINSKVSTFETDVQAIVSLETTNFTNMIADKTTEYNTLVQTTEDALDAKIASVNADVDQASSDIAAAGAALTDSANVANQQAINGSFFNLYMYGTLQTN